MSYKSKEYNLDRARRLCVRHVEQPRSQRLCTTCGEVLTGLSIHFVDLGGYGTYPIQMGWYHIRHVPRGQRARAVYYVRRSRSRRARAKV